MEVFGWFLFFGGALLTAGFALIGVDAAGIRVANLAGTVTGASLMISGSVFVIGGRIVTTFQKDSQHHSENAALERDSDAESESSPRDEAFDKKFLVASYILVGVIAIGVIITAVANS